MFSNTANNSASDSVNTRPKLKAYFNFITWVKNNEQKLAIILGYILVGGLFFGLGQYSAHTHPPKIEVLEPPLDLSQVNNSLDTSALQSGSAQDSGAVQGATSATDLSANCAGKIKGNISSSGKIYHLPGGAFYERTVAEICFNTEAQAQANGFRKSSR